ncbi:MAG: D-alanine--D-alanine ligase family protein [Bdellovibrionota bacterium]
MKKKIVFFFGGQSPEHEVSVRSIKNVIEALDKTKFDYRLVGISKQGSWFLFKDDASFKNLSAIKDADMKTQPHVTLVYESEKCHLLQWKTGEKETIDGAFPLIHGVHGEDGCIQGIFKMMNIPYVGCNLLSSAVGMDKEMMKHILAQQEISCSPYMLITREWTPSFQQVSEKLGNPFFLKPANMGSSVGVHKVKSPEDYKTFLADAFLYDNKVLAEKFIQGREIECAVLGNEKPKASLPGEIRPSHEFYSYEAKYLDENGADLMIPAKLSPDMIDIIQNLAIQTYQAMNCEGLTRVDFFVTEKNEIFVNEINTIPGFTNISMYPKMWEASGIGYSQLITELINLSFQRDERDKALNKNFKELGN